MYQRRLNPYTRKRLIEVVRVEKKTVIEACKTFGISRNTFYKWHKREDLEDLSTRPKTFPRQTPKWLQRIVVKIRKRVGLSSIKIHLLLKDKGLINPSTNKPLSEYAIRQIFDRYRVGYKFEKKREKAVRYEKPNPGDMAHIDVKKIRKIKGEKDKRYEAVFLDDCTRLSYVGIIPNKKAETLAMFLKRAVSEFKNKYNIKFSSILSDNGKEFTHHSKKSRKTHAFESMCHILGIKHKYTRIKRPQTNGKAERIWRTLDIEFYRKYRFYSPEHREEMLQNYLIFYNTKRYHLGINGLTPLEKLHKAA
jgi:transposase InsO family protein